MAFIPSRAKKHIDEESGTLNMNSMMDMMTIILLFLLKSFSTEGALVTPSEQLRLPTSAQTEKPVKELTVAVAKDVVMVNDIIVANVRDIHKDDSQIWPLSDKLTEYAEKEKELERTVGKKFKHEIIVQGDNTTPYELLYKVMLTCSKSEFYKMRLLTIRE